MCARLRAYFASTPVSTPQQRRCAASVARQGPSFRRAGLAPRASGQCIAARSHGARRTRLTSAGIGCQCRRHSAGLEGLQGPNFSCIPGTQTRFSPTPTFTWLAVTVWGSITPHLPRGCSHLHLDPCGCAFILWAGYRHDMSAPIGALRWEGPVPRVPALGIARRTFHCTKGD